MNEINEFMERLLDHHDVLNNHADALEDHELRISAIEKVINAPQPDAADVAVAEAKIDEPDEKDGEDKEEFKEEIKED